MLAPGIEQHRSRNLHLVAPARRVDAEGLELGEVAAAADAEIESSAAALVEQRGLLGKLQRMVERRQRHRRADAQALGAAEQEGRQRQCRRIDAERDEVMFGDPDVMIAQPLGQARLLEDEVEDFGVAAAELHAAVEEEAAARHPASPVHTDNSCLPLVATSALGRCESILDQNLTAAPTPTMAPRA